MDRGTTNAISRRVEGNLEKVDIESVVWIVERIYQVDTQHKQWVG